jgi:hypothetical protein
VGVTTGCVDSTVTGELVGMTAGTEACTIGEDDGTMTDGVEVASSDVGDSVPQA